jgi:hypothetical protein
MGFLKAKQILVSLKKPCRQIYDSQNIFHTFSKINRIQNIFHLIDQLMGVRIAVNARMRLGVFMPKMSPNGRGFESPSGQIIIFPINYTRNVKSM